MTPPEKITYTQRMRGDRFALIVLAGCGRINFDNRAGADGMVCVADKWQRVTPEPILRRLLGVAGAAANDVWVVGDQGTLLHFDGTSWTSIASGQASQLRGIWVSPTGAVWVASAGGHLLEWNGSSFDIRVMAGGGPYDAVSGFPDASVAVVGGVGANGQYTGYFIMPGTFGSGGGGGPELYGVWGAVSSEVFAVGQNGELQRSIMSGNNYSVLSSPVTRSLFGIRGTATNDIWAVGAMGQLMHYDGVVWNGSLVPSMTTDLRAVWGSGASDYWAVGPQGTIVHYDGVQWTESISCIADDLFSIWGSGADDIWVVGDNGTILHRGP